MHPGLYDGISLSIQVSEVFQQSRSLTDASVLDRRLRRCSDPKTRAGRSVRLSKVPRQYVLASSVPTFVVGH